MVYIKNKTTRLLRLMVGKTSYDNEPDQVIDLMPDEWTILDDVLYIEINPTD
jgi:hypothetical protein